MELEFTGEMWFWRGPAPHHFVTVPAEESEDIAGASSSVTYGWGMIPVIVQIGATRWTTSLFPKDGGYIVPIKLAVQQAERLTDGDVLTVRLSIEV